MSNQRKLKSIFVLFAVVATVIGSAFPAFAAFGATASVDVSDILSGQQATFVFTVTNTGAAGSEIPPEAGDAAINWVRIRPETFGTFTPDSAASAGWTPGLQDLDGDEVNDAAVFRAGEIGPAESATFTVVASAAEVAQDEDVLWSVRVSADNGATTSGASALGNLETTIRVLNVESVRPISPGGVTDGTATADQSNLVYESVIKNYGSAPLTVDPSLVSSGADQITDAGAALINPDDSAEFSFPVDLGSSTADRTFTGDAVATDAVANAFEGNSAPLTVQPAAFFSYANNTLQPRASVSGAAQAFTLTVNKANPPGVTFDAAETTLSFTNQANPAQVFSTDILSPAGVGELAGTQALSFASITIPGNPLSRDWDGTYTPSLRIEGTDTNDAEFGQTVSIGNNFEIDNLIPHVDPAILAPNGQINADNVPTAADGQSVTFDGPVNKGATPPNDTPDTTATVTECYLVVTDLANIELQRTAVPTGAGGCRNQGGSLDGSTALATGLDSARAYVEVVVSDAAGNTTLPTRSAGFVQIDNVDPGIAGALTGCGPNAAATCDDLTTIRVNLSEPVMGDFMPVDFLVDGDVVVSATESGCNTPAPTKTFCRQVVLTLLNGFEEDENKTVEYAFVGLPTRARAADGVGLTVEDAVFTAIDGIVPPLPTLDTVTQDGLDANGDPVSNPVAAQGGTFYTNQEQPTFTISGVSGGYTGIVALDTNGVPNFQAVPTETASADTVIAECVTAAGATSVSCTPDVAVGGDGTYPLLVASRDLEGNLSEGTVGGVSVNARPESLVIDNVAPQAAAFAPSGATSLDATFDESLAGGRNFAEDWLSRELLDNGKFRGFDATSVSGSGQTRTVNFDTPNAVTAADQLLYTFQGSPNARYQDRAGNYLGNFILNAPAE